MEIHIKIHPSTHIYIHPSTHEISQGKKNVRKITGDTERFGDSVGERLINISYLLI